MSYTLLSVRGPLSFPIHVRLPCMVRGVQMPELETQEPSVIKIWSPLLALPENRTPITWGAYRLSIQALVQSWPELFEVKYEER